MASKIYTLRDAIRENREAKERALHRIEVRELRAKVRRWEKLAARYQGEVHYATLERFRARLAEVM